MNKQDLKQLIREELSTKLRESNTIKKGDTVVYRDDENDEWSDNYAIYLGTDSSNPYKAGEHLIKIIGSSSIEQTHFIKLANRKK